MCNLITLKSLCIKTTDAFHYSYKIWQKAAAKLPPFSLGWSHYLILMRIESAILRKTLGIFELSEIFFSRKATEPQRII